MWLLTQTAKLLQCLLTSVKGLPKRTLSTRPALAATPQNKAQSCVMSARQQRIYPAAVTGTRRGLVFRANRCRATRFKQQPGLSARVGLLEVEQLNLARLISLHSSGTAKLVHSGRGSVVSTAAARGRGGRVCHAREACVSTCEVDLFAAAGFLLWQISTSLGGSGPGRLCFVPASCSQIESRTANSA